MRMSEKLEEVLGLRNAMLDAEPFSTAYDALSAQYGCAADDLLDYHGVELRQALRDSERLNAAPVVGLSEGIYGASTLEVDGLTAAQESALNGQRVRLVIEDAAMGRREGDA